MKGVLTRWALPCVLFALTTTTSSCDVEAARASAGNPTAATVSASPSAPDAGRRRDAGAPTKGHDAVIELEEPVMGLTRAQVRARLGAPTSIRGNDWITHPTKRAAAT